MTQPASLLSGAKLPRRDELDAELSVGASWRRDERRHRAGDLLGTYKIRLAITEDADIKGGTARERNEAADNLGLLVDNLEADLDRIVTCFTLSGSPSLLYWIFEAESDGTYLGAVIGRCTS